MTYHRVSTCTIEKCDKCVTARATRKRHTKIVNEGKFQLADSFLNEKWD